MEEVVHLRSRLPVRAHEFFKQGFFLDVTLVSPYDRYRANRIFLANSSSYFRRVFQSNPGPEIEIPFDEGNIMKEVLNFLRSDKLTFTMRNFHFILKAAEVYEIPSLRDAALFCLRERVDTKSFSNTVKFIARSLIDVGLDDIACEYAPLFVSEMNHPANIFGYLSPRLLAAVLSQPDMNKVPLDDKVAIIDDFIGDSKPTDERDMRVLEKFVDWTRPESYKLFTRFKCEWVTASTARPMLSKLLDVRRRTLAAMKAEVERAAPVVGRWFPMSWMSSISNGIDETASPIVDIVKFASTLGGAISQPVNPADFGLIQVSSTEPMHSDYSAKNVLVGNDSYFLSKDLMFTQEKGFVKLELGQNARFVIKRVVIDSEIPRPIGSKRAYPAAVEMKVRNGKDALVPEIVLYNGKGDVKIKEDVPCSMALFTMLGKSANGGAVMRVKNVELTGHFLAA